jgi:hypothetical protein
MDPVKENKLEWTFYHMYNNKIVTQMETYVRIFTIFSYIVSVPNHLKKYLWQE